MTDIIRAKARRLHLLKLRRTLLGYSTPPEVELEIEDLEGQAVPTAPMRGGVVLVERDLPKEITMLTRNFNRFVVISSIALSSTVLMSLTSFILILAGRGH